MVLNDAVLRLVLLAHVAATLMMVGLIWFVQVVHYPLFGAVGEDGFVKYAFEHSRRTTFVVALPMLLELATAGVLVLRQPMGVSSVQAWMGLALVAIIWLSTYALQVPQHTILGKGFDQGAHQLLVVSNWIRTIGWSMRGLLVVWMMFGFIR